MRAGLALTLLGIFVMGTAAPAAAQVAAPDFRLNVPMRGDGITPYTGYLVRGGLQSCTGDCTGGLSEPKAFVATGIPAVYTWMNTTFGIEAVNGFRGTVTLELLDLPPNVTTQTAPSVTLTDTTLLCDSYGCWVAVNTPWLLTAGSAAALAGATITVRATSGTIVHTAAVPITVVDQLPATTLFGFAVLNHVVAGGTTIQSVTTLTTPAPAGGVTIDLTSSNPAVAAVPASVFIPAGESGAFFNVTTNPVGVLTPVAISGSLNNETLSDFLTVTPPGGPDILNPGKAQYDGSKKQLSVEVTGTKANATLKVHDGGTGALIGTMTSGGTTYKGQFNWPTFPSLVSVHSSLGGVTQMFVSLK